MVLSSALLYMVMGSACADSSQPGSGGPRAAAPPSETPARWTRIEVADHYSFKGNVAADKDLSGIACLSDKHCLIGADEGREVQLVELSRQAKTLRVLETASLARTGEEIDIEAIAAEGGSYYVIGSHGISKKRGERQANRYKVFRLRVDRETGKLAGMEVASLWDVLSADAVLGEHFQQPLQRRGVNIEGLAVRNGRLFVGFRGPSVGGYAFVMEIAADDVFAGKPTSASSAGPQWNHVLHRLQLGEGLGIREIVAAKAGFLIIAGNSGSEPSEKYTEAENYAEDREFSMFLWDGKDSDVHKIGAIPDVSGKAEAMTILEESPSEITVLILFDGPKGGRPTVYHIH
jgi:hypothetical protein